MQTEKVVQLGTKADIKTLDRAHFISATALVAKILDLTPIRVSIHPGESAIDFKLDANPTWQTTAVVKLAGGAGLRKWTGETLKDFGIDEDRLAARRLAERFSDDPDADFKNLDARCNALVARNWRAISLFAMHLVEEERLKFQTLWAALDEMSAYASENP